MATISDCIRQILLEGETVNLPGFGILKVAADKAEGSKDGTFNPPGKTVVFSASTIGGDERLSECYARTAGLSADEARQQVLELLDAIRFAFEKGETYILTGVGLFSRDDDNRIRFTRDDLLVVDPEQFGLETLDLLELDAEEPEPVPVEVHSGPEPVSPEPWTTPARPRNRWRTIWIVTGSLIVILVVLLLLPVNTGTENEGFDPEKPGLFVKKERKVKEKEPAVKEQQEAVTSETGDEQISGETEPEAIPEDVPELKPGFYIIAGSFQNLQNATELQDKLTAKGFPAEIIYTENRMYRVSVKSYYEREKALEELPVIRQRTGLENAWLMSR